MQREVGTEINCSLPVLPEKIIHGQQGDLVVFAPGCKDQDRRYRSVVRFFQAICGKDDLLTNNMTNKMFLAGDQVVGEPEQPDLFQKRKEDIRKTFIKAISKDEAIDGFFKSFLVEIEPRFQ